MAADPMRQHDLDELESHVLDFNRQLLVSFWHFEAKTILDLIREVRELRAVVDDWSPIVGDYLARRLSEPIDDSRG